MSKPLHHQAQVANYFVDFQCIGSACPDSCCSGWNVTVDKQTYKKLKTVKDDSLSSAIKKNIQVTNLGKSNAYAQIVLNEQKTCPFLDTELLCSVQKKVGAEYLSNTCRDYPRQYSAWGQQTQLLGTLSCPETARLCLLSPEPWKFVEKSTDIPLGKKIHHIAGAAGDLSNIKTLHIRRHQMLQDFAIKVMQYRTLEVWQRILLVGLTCEKVDALAAENLEDEKADALLEQLVLQAQLVMLDGTFANQSQQLNVNQNVRTAQLTFINRMTDERILLSTANNELRINRAFLSCVEDAYRGLGFDVADLAASSQRLTDAQSAFMEFERNHPNILENYFINSLVLEVFPMRNEIPLVEQWMNLIIKYAMVRFYLIGMKAFYKEKFSPEHCVTLVYSFSKAVQHNSVFIPRIKEFLIQEKLNSLATMAILIR